MKATSTPHGEQENRNPRKAGKITAGEGQKERKAKERRGEKRRGEERRGEERRAEQSGAEQSKRASPEVEAQSTDVAPEVST